MPQLGFGVYQIPEKTERIVTAIKTGYRHIDTAQYYRNEVGVGQAIRRLVCQEDFFITTKLATSGDRDKGTDYRL